MKQLAVVSGKGGTGKTTICASLVELAKKKVVADCDVEAPNLHLLLDSKILRENDFYGSKVARIDLAECVQCGKCREVCRFDAITENYEVDPFKCEGCAACVYVCPEKAAEISDTVTGKTFFSTSRAGKFSHAKLNIGADGSGKLVTEVRKNAAENAEPDDLVIIDGSPGIACTVIASITGCEAILIVSEPTVSGKHDLQRVLDLAKHFGIKVFVCINKYDLNQDMSDEISRECDMYGAKLIGRIPFDPNVNKALTEGVPVVKIKESAAGEAIKGLWNELKDSLKIS